MHFYSFSFPIPIIIIFLSLLLSHSSAQPGLAAVSHYCSPSNGNYTNSSTFATNLATLLADITTASSTAGGFYNLTAGENSGLDQVNGIGLCRGDLSASDCKSCLSAAADSIRELCPNQKEAIVWNTPCLLRYSNRTIFNSKESSPATYLYNTGNVSDPTRFNQQLGTLLSSLESKAAAGDSQSKYAAGSAKVTDFSNVYALVQCTPDLSALECSSCIEDRIYTIPRCCANSMGAQLLSPSCTVRFESSPFLTQAPPSPPPQSSSRPSSNSSTVVGKQGGKKGTTPIIAIVVPVVVCLVIVSFICGWCLLRRKRRQKVETSSFSFNTAEDGINHSDSLLFDFGTIRVATNAFSDVNKLGRGGFGAVYKGILSNGEQVAVKRLAKNSGQGEVEFKNEVLLLAKLQHRNLVKLLGFCLEGEERLLIYEFVPNRSLDYFLFDPEKRGQLNCQTRFNIIAGIARGLLYLHEDSRLRIIHRDLKASNILLDADMIPKIADFGLARLFQFDQTQGDTNRVAGTYGYMAPEYALHGLFSGKSDVFSFGVLVLEMITGRKSVGLYQGEESEDLVSWVWRNWREGTAVDVIDETIPAGSRTEMMRCVHIGLLCVQDDATDRPTMSSVVLMLSSHSITLPVVSHPAYITRSLSPLCTLSEEHSSEITKSSKSKLTQNSVNVDSSNSLLLP